MTQTTSRRSVWQILWAASAPMTAFAALFAVLGVLSAVGLLIDPRLVTGAPAWMKPLKFAVSLLIYGASMAWMLSHLPNSRLKTISSNAIIGLFIIEAVIVTVQAARGVASHFNAATPLDDALFTGMGAMIAAIWCANLALAIALLRTKWRDAPMGLALRLGLLIALVGMAQAVLMVFPTAQQLSAWQGGAPVTMNGGHTIGAIDGGAGLPVTGWSTLHGDLRVGHFVGIHALQILPLIAWLLSMTALSAAKRLSLVTIVGAYYLSITLLVTWQALRAESLIAPSALTSAVFAALSVLALIAAALRLSADRGRGAP